MQDIQAAVAKRAEGIKGWIDNAQSEKSKLIERLDELDKGLSSAQDDLKKLQKIDNIIESPMRGECEQNILNVTDKTGEAKIGYRGY